MEEAPIIDGDVPCENCKYNLRGLPADRACPECGQEPRFSAPMDAAENAHDLRRYFRARPLLKTAAQAGYPVDALLFVGDVIRFLHAEFPRIFAHARIRTYGNPGLRQTRWIVGRRQLTLDDIRSRERPPDAIARCAWWVELHNARELVHWERFEHDHVYYIPLSCMVPRDADNIVAAGRSVDADVQALSAIRVMGPCIAMGAAAAHALDLAGTGSVYDVDVAELQRRLTDNLDRTD